MHDVSPPLTSIRRKKGDWINDRQGFVLGAGLGVAIAAAAGAWYLAAGTAHWLAGGLLAGVAFVSGAAVLVMALRFSFGHRVEGETGLLFSGLDAALNGRVITDAEGKVTYANAAYRIMTGAARGSVPSPLKVVDPEYAGEAGLADLLDLARSGGQGQETVKVNLGVRGTRWWRFAAGDADGGDSIVWQVVDVTSPEVEAEADRSAKVMLGQSLDVAGLGFLVLNEDGAIAEANQTLAEWLGLPAEDLSGEPIIKYAPGAPAGVSGFADGPTGPVLFRPKAGGALRLEVAQAEVREAQGGPQALVVLRQPASEAQQVLSSSSDMDADTRYARYFAEAPVGIATVDSSGDIQECNQVFESLFNTRPRNVRVTLADVFSREDVKEVLAGVSAALGGGRTGTPIDVRLKDLPDKQGQLYIHRMGDGAGGGEQVILYFIDATEQKNLEIQFAQSQKMQAVGQLAGGVAHDFNNLLTAITGFCDLLLVRHGPGDQSFADIMQIKQNANRAANLVRQLLAFSRQQTLRPKVLIITDVLAEISNLVRRLIGEDIELKMIHGRDVGPVKADQGQLEQVIINLAVNARDAMPDGGTLIFRTANISREQSRRLGHTMMPANDYILIEVADTGTGIPKEHLGKIFEPFFSTKDVGKGTGLGLSTVYGIVKQTGGFIFPSSETGKGAIFSIYLPVHRQEETAKVEARPTEIKPRDLTGKGTVLLVEDEDAVRTFASRALRNKGYNVFEADSGEAALNLVDEHDGTIDLLISDVVMPQMDGPTLVKEIRGRSHDMKIIFISGYAEDAFKKSLGKDEVFSFLPKPFSLKQLAEKVKEVLEAE